MSRYDGLIIPRSYNEYINKTDAATLQQALQLSGVLSSIVAAGDNKAVKSSAVNNALIDYINKTDADTIQQALQLPGVLSGAVAAGDNKAVTSDAVNVALGDYYNKQSVDNKLNGKLDKSILNGNLFFMEYVTELGNYELPPGGNGFIFRLLNNKGYEYIQIAIAPLSYDYSIWRPNPLIQIRVKNPANGTWLAWKTLSNVVT